MMAAAPLYEGHVRIYGSLAYKSSAKGLYIQYWTGLVDPIDSSSISTISSYGWTHSIILKFIPLVGL